MALRRLSLCIVAAQHQSFEAVNSACADAEGGWEPPKWPMFRPVWPNLRAGTERLLCSGSAGINGAVWSSSGRLPLTINGTIDFGTECGGPDWWPYDLSTCVLSPHNSTPRPPPHKNSSLPLSSFPVLQESYLTRLSHARTSVWGNSTFNVEIINDINADYFTVKNKQTQRSPSVQGQIIQDEVSIDCNYLSPWGRIVAHL